MAHIKRHISSSHRVKHQRRSLKARADDASISTDAASTTDAPDALRRAPPPTERVTDVVSSTEPALARAPPPSRPHMLRTRSVKTMRAAQTPRITSTVTAIEVARPNVVSIAAEPTATSFLLDSAASSSGLTTDYQPTASAVLSSTADDVSSSMPPFEDSTTSSMTPSTKSNNVSSPIKMSIILGLVFICLTLLTIFLPKIIRRLNGSHKKKSSYTPDTSLDSSLQCEILEDLGYDEKEKIQVSAYDEIILPPSPPPLRPPPPGYITNVMKPKHDVYRNMNNHSSYPKRQSRMGALRHHYYHAPNAYQSLQDPKYLSTSDPRVSLLPASIPYHAPNRVGSRNNMFVQGRQVAQAHQQQQSSNLAEPTTHTVPQHHPTVTQHVAESSSTPIIQGYGYAL